MIRDVHSEVWRALAALAWLVGAAVAGLCAVRILLGPTTDLAGWVWALAFAGVGAWFVWQAWREWTSSEALRRLTDVPPQQTPAQAAEFPGAWKGGAVPLETQIEKLSEAGLSMAPGRTIDELLISYPRAEFEEGDPYGLILFMYGVEVEAEPWGRVFCERGWNFDMECLEEAGDYVRAFEGILRTTGHPELATEMHDDFRPGAETCEIRYSIRGRKRVLTARIDHDWADPEAMGAFFRDIEGELADGRHFWAADNGQSSVLFFLTDAEAAKVNAQREDVLVRLHS